MSEFILVWVLVTFNGWKGDTSYSPPVKTVEDCQRMQDFVRNQGNNKTQCIQVNILKKASEK